MTPEKFLKDLTELFKQHADAETAKAMSKYMKDLFPFYGLKKPIRSKLIKPLFQKAKEDVSEEWLLQTTDLLWQKRQREYHYIAIDLLKVFRKHLTPASFDQLEKMLVSNSWWDSVDGLTGNAISPLVKKYPELKKHMKRFVTEDNMWLRRASIIHQLPYHKQTDQKYLFDACNKNMHDKEFFIRKAIGWALRQYAKDEPKAVYAYVEANKSKLSNLSIREALKHK
jgi:3-methyladenine DNA glycosylase AlkD